MNRIIKTIVLIAISICTLKAQDNAILNLENNQIQLKIDTKTGALVGLLNKQSQYQYIKQPALSLGLELRIPLHNKRNHKARSEEQLLSEIIKVNEQCYDLVWKEIVGEDIGNINVKVRARVAIEEEKITFNLTIANNSAYTIDEVHYPIVGGFWPPEETKSFHSKVVHMNGSFVDINLLNPVPQGRGYWGVNYPTMIHQYPRYDCMMPFELLQMDDQGIYFGTLDNEFNNMFFLHEFKPGFLDSKRNRISYTHKTDEIPAGYVFSIIRTPFLQPGEVRDFKPAVLEMYEGDWHSGVEPYKKWRNNWYKKDAYPDWVDTVDAWQTIQMLDAVGTLSYTYNDLIDIATEAKSKGVEAIQIIGWSRDGQDGSYPYFETDPRLGTREELKQAISAIEEMGIHTYLFCKFNWADATIQEYEVELEKHAVIDIHGKRKIGPFFDYQTLTGSNKTGTDMCHLSPGFRDFANKQLKNILELGSSGVLYDQVVAHGGLCFDTVHHEHRKGASCGKGAALLAKEFHNTTQSYNKNIALAGEGPFDAFTQYYSVHYTRSWGEHFPVLKYINPKMKFATCLTGWDDREMVNQCLAYGYIINYEPYNFKGRLRDFPETVNYGRKAQKLRKELKDYIWLGKFLDTQTATVTSLSDNMDYYYAVFENTTNGRKVVIIINDNIHEPLKVKVSLENLTLPYKVYSIDQDLKTIYDEKNKTYSISPRSLIVLMEK